MAIDAFEPSFDREGKRGTERLVKCTKSHSKQVAEPGFKLQVCAYNSPNEARKEL